MKVDAPFLLRAEAVAQSAERDRELGTPAFVVNLGPHLPGAVPVEIKPPSCASAFQTAARPPSCQLAVVLHPSGIGPEHKTVLAVPERIQDKLETVCFIERGVASTV